MKLKNKWKRGLPYVGNKGQKVEQIMKILPDGKRLVVDRINFLSKLNLSRQHKEVS